MIEGGVVGGARELQSGLASLETFEDDTHARACSRQRDLEQEMESRVSRALEERTTPQRSRNVPQS